MMTLLLTVGACAPAGQVTGPPPLSAAAWSGQAEASAPIGAPLAELLNASELQTLITQSFNNNSDIRLARARVAQSHALLRAARQATLPEVSLVAGANRRFEKTGSNPLDFTDAFARLDVEIELDIFGRLNAGKNAAVSRASAAELQRDAIILAIETDVASAFVQRAAIARRITILDKNIDRAVELERVIRVRSAQGAATRVDQGLQTIRLLNLRDEESRMRQALDQTRTALAILTGAEAPQFSVGAADVDSITIPQLSPAPPRELLAVRPDVRASEALIQAANGDVRQARAAFYPQISFSAQSMLASAATGPLSTSLNLGSSLLAPIFSRGRLQSAFQFATAVQLEAVERYRQTILNALAEVEDAQSARLRSAERAKLLDAIVKEARLTAHLAQVQFIEGEEDLQNVLNAENSLSSAEDAQVVSWQESVFAQIALYRAMGGYRKRTPVFLDQSHGANNCSPSDHL